MLWHSIQGSPIAHQVFCVNRLCRWPFRVTSLLLMAAALALAVLSQAAVDLDRMSRLAAERYGPAAVDRVTAWRELLTDLATLDEAEKLQRVNLFFNRRIRFVDDPIIWNQADYWATPLEVMGKGQADCEDYSIAKYMTLLLAGVPRERLRMIYVRAQIGGPDSRVSQAHMVVGYYATPDAEPVILDNLITDIRPASRRGDLFPVFSFNSDGLWVAGQTASAADPTTRLSRWRDVLDRMRQEGLI